MKNTKTEERMLILNMVSEGKITVDESIKLLEALDNSPRGAYEGNGYPGYESYNFEEKINKFSNSVDSFARELGGKASETFKDVEPKLKNATKIVIEKTVNVLNDITNSLNESINNLESNKQENCGCGCGCNEDEPVSNGEAPKGCGCESNEAPPNEN